MRIWKRKKNPGTEEATRALEDAKQNLQATRERDPEVKEVSRSLKSLRVENHFREHLEAIMGG